MASSSDEAESLPDSVSTYYFQDQDDEPVSFSVLPVRWSDEDGFEDAAGTVTLNGTVDGGLRKIYKAVKAWKFNLSGSRPEVWVLSKENNWFKLDKPRRSFQDTIRTVLITLHCLHYAKSYPYASGDALWGHLSRVLGFYEVRPAPKDLEDHIPLIKEAMARDESLAKSKVLGTLMEDKPWERRQMGESVARPSFIVDDTEDFMVDDAGEESEEEFYDSVCAFCDNGGELLCCEGKCMRSFHATEEAGEDSICESLGFSRDEVDAMQNFNCKNCTYNQHQCFACGKLGSSDASSAAEVFQCVSATCGYFYHPHCVAKLLHHGDEVAAEKLKMQIAGGESFTCPMHKCCVCSQTENKRNPALQFAVCRRCPTAYHRKCLPREIAFENSDDDMITRAWEDLLPNRILIYCLKHDIIEDLGTPMRDHVKFPSTEARRVAVGQKRKTQELESPCSRGKEILKNKSVTSDKFSKVASEKQSTQKKKLPLMAKEGEKVKKVTASSGQVAKKVKVTDESQKLGKGSAKSVSLGTVKTSTRKGHNSLGERLFSYMTKSSEQETLGKHIIRSNEQKGTQHVKTASKKSDSLLPPLDAETEKRLLALIEDATTRVSMRDVLQKHKAPSTYGQPLKSIVDRTITTGKVDAAVQAVRTALKRLEEGDSSEDAKTVCDPDVLTQIFKWKEKLRVYLSPFLFGMRYTSFGRHFTKVEKLQEIVDRLHWYVEDGDTIVDFCCGTNDFSCLMSKKLEETGKKCSYKNYDCIQAKNNFNFERKDWMTVKPSELPNGRKLIMGLNPPFGVKAALANKFIDKALEFEPKLLILIVPSETERLDEKKLQYDLVWEDDRLLSGKSFYLPGSADAKDKHIEQWNVNPPSLYLWSHREWTEKHKIIAENRGHIQREGSYINENFNQSQNLHDVQDDQDHCTGTLSMISGDFMEIGRIDKFTKECDQDDEARDRASGSEGVKGSLSQSDSARESQEGIGHANSPPNVIPTKKLHGRRALGGETDDNSCPEGMGDRVSMSEGVKGSSSQISSGRESRESIGHVKSPPNVRRMHGQHTNTSMSASHTETLYGRRGSTVPEDWGLSSHEVPLDNQAVEMDRHHKSPIMSVPHAENLYGGRGSCALPDDLGSSYGLNSEQQYSSQRQLSVGSASAMGIDNNRPYAAEVEENHWRDLERQRSQVRLYGQQDRNLSQVSYVAGHDARFGQFGSAPSSRGFMSSVSASSDLADMSATQRYAPRLDELNPMRMSSRAPESPVMSANGHFNDPARVPLVYRRDSRGFASGPSQGYSQQNSAGWFDE